MDFGWIVFWIAAVLAVWVPADFFLGRAQHLKKMSKNHFPARKSDMELITRGPDLFADLFSEIKQAKQHIHILFYIIKNDKISQEFLELLKKKAQEGVEVRLLVDWVGSGLKRKTIKALKASGVAFAYSNTPRLPFLFYSSQVRNHRKITVIDGHTGYLGGFNIGKEYNDQDKKLSPWRDYHLKMKGEGVRDLQIEFLSDWRRAAKINLLHNAAYFPVVEKGASRHQLIPTEGTMLEKLISDLIERSRTSILIGSPYFIPSRKVFSLLRAAIKRGVAVTILVPLKADHILVKEASHPYLRTLLKDGADVYQYLKGFYHAKVLIVDDQICDIGTANFDKRSMFLNDELNCMVYDPAFIKKTRQVIAEDLLDSRQASLKDLSPVSLLLSIKETAAKTISYFL